LKNSYFKSYYTRLAWQYYLTFSEIVSGQPGLSMACLNEALKHLSKEVVIEAVRELILIDTAVRNAP
jgi:hypothetical protein